jgi:hypothetical protein
MIAAGSTSTATASAGVTSNPRRAARPLFIGAVSNMPNTTFTQLGTGAPTLILALLKHLVAPIAMVHDVVSLSRESASLPFSHPSDVRTCSMPSGSAGLLVWMTDPGGPGHAPNDRVTSGAVLPSEGCQADSNAANPCELINRPWPGER